MQKKYKNTYTKQKIYIKIQKYTTHKNILNTREMSKPKHQTQHKYTNYMHIQHKKIYTAHKIYKTEKKYTPKKSNTHKK